MPIKTKPWPTKDACADIGDMRDRLVDLVRSIYDLQRYHDGEEPVYHGHDLPGYMLANSLGAECFTNEMFETIDSLHDREPIYQVMLFALQLGVEQGRRMERDKWREEGVLSPLGKIETARMLLTSKVLPDDAPEKAQERREAMIDLAARILNLT